MDDPGGYTVGSFGNYAAVARAVNCRGYDGGPIGFQLGPTTTSGIGAVNGHILEHCYTEGDGSAGSSGILNRRAGTQFIGNTIKGYAVGIRHGNRVTGCGTIHTKLINVTQAFTGEGANDFGMAIIHPRGWIGANSGFLSSSNVAARDPQGVYA